MPHCLSKNLLSNVLRLDDGKKPALPLKPNSKPPRLSRQARQWVAASARRFLVPFWVTGRLYKYVDPASPNALSATCKTQGKVFLSLDASRKPLVDEIVKQDSAEMDIVAEYFARFLEVGLAREP